MGDAHSYQLSNASQYTLATETIAALRDIAPKWIDEQIDAAPDSFHGLEKKRQ